MGLLKIKKFANKIRKIMVTRKSLILVMFYLVLFFDIFFYLKISNSLSIFLIAIWIFFIYIFNIKPNQSITLGLFSYVSTFTFQFFGKMMTVEKGVTWLAIFLTIALVQMLFERQPINAK